MNLSGNGEVRLRPKTWVRVSSKQMKPSGSVLIVEPDSGGHRANHVGIISRYLSAAGVQARLLSSAKAIAEGGFDDLGLETDCLENEDVALPIYARFLPGSFRHQVKMYRQIFAYLDKQQSSIRCVIFPTLQVSGLLPAGLSKAGFPVPWVGVVMAPGAHLRANGIDTPHTATELWVQARAYRRLAKQRNCIRIGSFDPLFVDWLKEPTVVYCPDPVRIARTDDVEELVPRTDKPVVLVAGSIDKRKKVCELAEVLCEVNRTAPLRLVIAGKPNDEIRTKLEGSPALQELQESESLDLILRRLSDFEMDYLFQRADIVWSGNLRAYGSSGAVVRAGMHGKPVVTMQNSVLGNWMQSVDGGPTADLSSAAALKKIFHKLVTDKVFRETTGRNNYGLFGDNTEQKYCEVLLSPLKLAGTDSPEVNGDV